MKRIASTSDVTQGNRLDYWNGILRNTFPGMSIVADKGLNACWEFLEIGDLRVTRLSSDRANIYRWRSTPPDPSFTRTIAHIQCQGACVTFEKDRSNLMNAGDLVLGTPCKPYAVNISDHNVAILIDFPSDFLGSSIPAEGKRVGSSKSVTRLLDFSLSVLDEEIKELHDDPDSEDCIVEVLSTLLNNCVEAEHSDEEDDLMVCHRIFEFIDNSLQDNTLRTNMIATHLAISTKQVQRVFAGLGMTPTQFIMQRRINLAALMLRSSAFDGSITDLALETGFYDAAHFCRSFRRSLGVTPTEYAKALSKH